MKPIPFQQVTITDGFWKRRQDINRTATAQSVYHQFDLTGRIGAFRCDWKPGMPDQPHYFWDSDVAKWIEGAAYLIEQQPDAQLEAQIDAIVDEIAAHQEPDGYFNIYYTVVEPGKRFTNRSHHELYCAGHLIEAACAYAQATGKTKLLDCMKRYAALIDRVFRMEHSAAFSTPGHEEIELALVRLADYTGEARWLELARWFVDTRGTAKNDYNSFRDQSHLPVRRQRTAEGHAVRAMYLYSAVADLAARDHDEQLADTCRALFDSITRRRMYVTGGIGSTRAYEGFTIDYDLPNLTAYSESCAAISLVMFCRRMQQLEPCRAYADTIERVLYNGFLSSASLDGRAFFYENPLEIRPELIDRAADVRDARTSTPNLGITERVEVFSCSCCPPNILRFTATLGGLLYSADESARTVYVHQYMASDTAFSFAGADAHLTQETDYPISGHIRLTWHGPDAVLALRVPGWVRDYPEAPADGYLRRPVQNGSVIELNFPMEVRLVAAHPGVQEDSGRYAVMRGPVVYCMEALDNGTRLRDVELLRGSAFTVCPDSTIGLPALETDARRREASPDAPLYTDLADTAYRTFRARLIPYFAFANRGESEMLVWTRIGQ